MPVGILLTTLIAGLVGFFGVGGIGGILLGGLAGLGLGGLAQAFLPPPDETKPETNTLLNRLFNTRSRTVTGESNENAADVSADTPGTARDAASSEKGTSKSTTATERSSAVDNTAKLTPLVGQETATTLEGWRKATEATLAPSSKDSSAPDDPGNPDRGSNAKTDAAIYGTLAAGSYIVARGYNWVAHRVNTPVNGPIRMATNALGLSPGDYGPLPTFAEHTPGAGYKSWIASKTMPNFVVEGWNGFRRGGVVEGLKSAVQNWGTSAWTERPYQRWARDAQQVLGDLEQNNRPATPEERAKLEKAYKNSKSKAILENADKANSTHRVSRIQQELAPAQPAPVDTPPPADVAVPTPAEATAANVNKALEGQTLAPERAGAISNDISKTINDLAEGRGTPEQQKWARQLQKDLNGGGQKQINAEETVRRTASEYNTNFENNAYGRDPNYLTNEMQRQAHRQDIRARLQSSGVGDPSGPKTLDQARLESSGVRTHPKHASALEAGVDTLEHCSQCEPNSPGRKFYDDVMSGDRNAGRKAANIVNEFDPAVNPERSYLFDAMTKQPQPQSQAATPDAPPLVSPDAPPPVNADAPPVTPAEPRPTWQQRFQSKLKEWTAAAEQWGTKLTKTKPNGVPLSESPPVLSADNVTADPGQQAPAADPAKVAPVPAEANAVIDPAKAPPVSSQNNPGDAQPVTGQDQAKGQTQAPAADPANTNQTNNGQPKPVETGNTNSNAPTGENAAGSNKATTGQQQNAGAGGSQQTTQPTGEQARPTGQPSVSPETLLNPNSLTPSEAAPAGGQGTQPRPNASQQGAPVGDGSPTLPETNTSKVTAPEVVTAAGTSRVRNFFTGKPHQATSLGGNAIAAYSGVNLMLDDRMPDWVRYGVGAPTTISGAGGLTAEAMAMRYTAQATRFEAAGEAALAARATNAAGKFSTASRTLGTAGAVVAVPLEGFMAVQSFREGDNFHGTLHSASAVGAGLLICPATAPVGAGVLVVTGTIGIGENCVEIYHCQQEINYRNAMNLQFHKALATPGLNSYGSLNPQLIAALKATEGKQVYEYAMPQHGDYEHISLAVRDLKSNTQNPLIKQKIDAEVAKYPDGTLPPDVLLKYIDPAIKDLEDAKAQALKDYPDWQFRKQVATVEGRQSRLQGLASAYVGEAIWPEHWEKERKAIETIADIDSRLVNMRAARVELLGEESGENKGLIVVGEAKLPSYQMRYETIKTNKEAYDRIAPVIPVLEKSTSDFAQPLVNLRKNIEELSAQARKEFGKDFRIEENYELADKLATFEQAYQANPQNMLLKGEMLIIKNQFQQDEATRLLAVQHQLGAMAYETRQANENILKNPALHAQFEQNPQLLLNADLLAAQNVYTKAVEDYQKVEERSEKAKAALAKFGDVETQQKLMNAHDKELIAALNESRAAETELMQKYVKLASTEKNYASVYEYLGTDIKLKFAELETSDKAIVRMDRENPVPSRQLDLNFGLTHNRRNIPFLDSTNMGGESPLLFGGVRPRQPIKVTESMRLDPATDVMRLVTLQFDGNENLLKHMAKDLNDLGVPMIRTHCQGGKCYISMPKFALAGVQRDTQHLQFDANHYQLALPSGKAVPLTSAEEVLQQRPGDWIPTLMDGQIRWNRLPGDRTQPLTIDRNFNWQTVGAQDAERGYPKDQPLVYIENGEVKIDLNKRNLLRIDPSQTAESVPQETQMPVLRFNLDTDKRSLKSQAEGEGEKLEILTPEKIAAMWAKRTNLPQETPTTGSKEIPLTFDVRGINNRVQLRLNDGLKEPSEQPRTETDKPEIQLLPLLTLPLKTPPKR